jgi:hypothetical protein
MVQQFGKVKLRSSTKIRKEIRARAEMQLDPGYKEAYVNGDVDGDDYIKDHWGECYMEELIASPVEEAEGEAEFFQDTQGAQLFQAKE